MSRRLSLRAVCAAVFLLLGACGTGAPRVVGPSGSPPAERGPDAVARTSQVGGRAARADVGTIHNPSIREPLPVILPEVVTQDSPLIRATKLARFMEARWPRIHLRPDADALGTVAAFNIAIDYDRYAGDERVWEDSVHETAGDLREASVELLKLSLLYFPKLAYATVWEDSRLMFFWSRRQIEAIGPAKGYREFHAYQALTRWAQFQPPLLEYARRQAAAPVLGH